MKLIKYELYKLFNKKVLIILAFILFALNCFLFYNEQTNSFFVNSKDYKYMESTYSKMNPQEALVELSNQQSYLTVISLIASDKEIGIDDSIIRNNIQYFLSLCPEPITYDEILKRYEYLLKNTELLGSIQSANYTLMNQLEYLISYPQFINSMDEKAKSMETVSIFNKKNTFAHRNIIKTIEDFADLKGVSLSLGQEEGVLAVSTYKLTDYFLIVLILLICIFLFAEERESGMLRLVKSTKKGRLPLAFSKIIVLLIITFILATLFYGINFFIAEGMFGFGDTSRLIQSMSSFRDADIPMTLNEYFIWFSIIKLLVLMLFAIIASLIFTTVSSTKLSYLVTGSILTLSYLAYQFIYPTSYINVLKYLNIFAFLDSYHLLANYTNLNIFGYPISRVATSIATMIIVGVICFTLYLYCFTKNCNQFLNLNLSILKRKKIINLKKGSSNLFVHELYKNLLSNKILFLILFSCIIGYNILNFKELYFTFDKQVYHSYAMTLAGEITEEKSTFISEEQLRFDNIPEQMQKLSQQLKNNEIDKNDYEVKAMEISNFARLITGFRSAKSQYESLKLLQDETNIRGHFISSNSSDYIFNNSSRDLLMGLIYSVILILSLGNIFSCEYNKGMINLIRSTRNGRGRLFFCKSMIAYGTSFILMCTLYLPFYITLIYRYKFNSWTAPIQSIMLYRNINMNVSVIEFVIIVLLFQLLTAFLMTSIMILLSQLLKKQTITILIGSITLAVPFIFSFLSTEIFQKGSLVAGFHLYQRFTEKNSSSFVWYYLVVLILLGVITKIISYRRFCVSR